MSAITLQAHFDGQHVCLDEPHNIPPNAKLLVTVLPENGRLENRDEWYALGRRSLARAYGDDEPDYSACLGRKVPDE
jgi:hypothetical protein